MLPTKFQFIWPSGYREEDFLEINQSETRTAVAAMFDNGYMAAIGNSYF
jgi:hypothetical protein